MIWCGFKGIYRNARKAVEASICGMTLLSDIYSNNKFTKIPNMKCCLGECRVLLQKRKNEPDCKKCETSCIEYFMFMVQVGKTQHCRNQLKEKLPRQKKKNRMKMEEKYKWEEAKRKKEVQGNDDQRKNWNSNRPFECIH